MAPTILQTKNLCVVIYPKDHNPPHVHVIGPDAEAKFKIADLSCYYSRGFSDKSLKYIEKFLKDKINKLMEAWNEYFGP